QLRSDGSDAWEQLGVIDSAVDRGAVLCDRLLAYGGCAVQKNCVCCINDLIRQINTVVRATHPDRVFQLFLTRKDTYVWGDEAQLSQILLNLMTNAVEASDRTGGLEVRTFTDMCQTDEVLPSAAEAGACDFVHIEVVDQGVGIPQPELERIFDPFYSSKGRGRGLGLAAVLGIVRQHGGDIRTQSQVGQGSTFTVSLPRTAKPHQTNEMPSEVTLHNIAGLGLRVLLVDDNNLVLDATTRLLESHGLSVDGAASGAEAMEIFRREGDVYHAVILDQTMPGMTGIETYANLRELGATGRGVLVSGYSENSRIECPAELTFLAKPFLAKDILAAIAETEPTGQTI
ncbi:MAG: ATP-binding protein, partial [Planctomycetota bacterium]